MKRLYLAPLIVGIIIFTNAAAEQTAVKQQTQGEVNFVTGGVGGSERQAMKALRADYNLQLLFMLKDNGTYLSDVKVRVEDVKGSVFLETVTDGPLLFAKLKPGNYVVNASQAGLEINKKVLISANKSIAVTFAWPKQ